jgi:hypothetical protein
MKLALIVAPVVVSYAPIVWPLEFAINRVLPDIVIWPGEFSPVIRFAFITAPVLASYSLTVLPFMTYRLLPDAAASRLDSPAVIKFELTRDPVAASYSATFVEPIRPVKSTFVGTAAGKSSEGGGEKYRQQ